MPKLGEIAITANLYRQRFPRAERLDRDGPVDVRDLEVALEALRWLNGWGCRIDKTALSSLAEGLGVWAETDLEPLKRELSFSRSDPVWHGWPSIAVEQGLTVAFDGLRSARGHGVKSRRELGAVAASKLLAGLLPNLCVAWDRAIMRHYKYESTGIAFVAHLKHSDAEIDDLIRHAAQKGVVTSAIPEAVGRAGTTLPKLLDEFHWVTISKRFKIPDAADLKRWLEWQ